MRRMMGAAVLALLAASAAGAQPTLAPAPPPVPVRAALPPPGTTAAPDYGQGAAWLCRPERAGDTCAAADLNAISYDVAGQRAPSPFVPARDPGIDCFYVYPTVSNDPSLYSDLTPAATEEGRAAIAQAARFRSACRLYVPLYRQLTLTALRAVTGGATLPAPIERGRNYDDLKAAWASYLARDNRGRGVVLIGHSQGAILLKRLIAEEIDGRPAQRLLVSALLAGNRDLTVKTGSDRGGSFRGIPVCRTDRQTGCVVGWSSYAAGDVPAQPEFGGSGTRPGETAVCVNPARLAGGRAPLDGFVPKLPVSPAADPPFIEQRGQFAGQCVAAGTGGQVLEVSTEPGPLAPLLATGLARVRIPGWGLHVLDISLVQGDLIRLVEAQARAWPGRR